MRQALESPVGKVLVGKRGNLAYARQCDQHGQNAPALELSPHQDEGVHANVQLAGGVARVQPAQTVSKAHAFLFETRHGLSDVLPVEHAAWRDRAVVIDLFRAQTAFAVVEHGDHLGPVA